MPPTKTEPVTHQDLETLLKAIANGSGKNGDTPKNWPGFAYRFAKDFGGYAMLLAGLLGFGGWLTMNTLPKWVDSNIETQHSLTENLEKQTEAIADIAEAERNSQAANIAFKADHEQQRQAQQAMVSTLEAIHDSLKEK